MLENAKELRISAIAGEFAGLEAGDAVEVADEEVALARQPRLSLPTAGSLHRFVIF
jgi:hypothetical protein